MPEGERKGEEGRVGEWGNGEGREEGGGEEKRMGKRKKSEKKKGTVVTVYWEVEIKEAEGERRGKGKGGRFNEH